MRRVGGGGGGGGDGEGISLDGADVRIGPCARGLVGLGGLFDLVPLSRGIAPDSHAEAKPNEIGVAVDRPKLAAGERFSGTLFLGPTASDAVGRAADDLGARARAVAGVVS